MKKPRVVVTFSPSPEIRDGITETLGEVAELVYLPEVNEDGRVSTLASADAVLAWSVGAELRDQELAALKSVGLVQLLSAGVDHIPLESFPEGVPVASNAGAYAEPMAEHVLAMALALAKHLPQNHAKLKQQEFDQQTPTRPIRGSLVGVLGFGGIGQASAKLFRALGARIHAINRTGRAAGPVDQMGDDGRSRCAALDG